MSPKSNSEEKKIDTFPKKFLQLKNPPLKGAKILSSIEKVIWSKCQENIASELQNSALDFWLWRYTSTRTISNQWFTEHERLITMHTVLISCYPFTLNTEVTDWLDAVNDENPDFLWKCMIVGQEQEDNIVKGIIFNFMWTNMGIRLLEL